MSKVTIVIEDDGDSVHIHGESEPGWPKDPRKMTPAQIAGLIAVNAATKHLKEDDDFEDGRDDD